MFTLLLALPAVSAFVHSGVTIPRFSLSLSLSGCSDLRVMRQLGGRTIGAVALLSSRFSQETLECLHCLVKVFPVQLHHLLCFLELLPCLFHLRLPQGLLSGYLLGLLRAEEGVDSPVKRGLHHHLVSRNHSNALELGDIRAFGSEVNRLYIHEGLFDRDNDQVSAGDSRPLLVPERQLLGNGGVLIDHRHDLHWAQDQLILR